MKMKVLANIIWIAFGGLVTAIAWALIGVVLCITIVGIPAGKQCFKAAGLTLTPFGHQVVYGGGAGSKIANFFWIILCGWWMALVYIIAGIINCITVIGIPSGTQAFKMAKLAWAPFGAEIQ